MQDKLLTKGLRFAQKFIDINSEDTEIIYRAHKSLLLMKRTNG